MQVFFVRRSDFRPTNIIGVVGQKCKTSGYHYVTSARELIRFSYLCLPYPSRSLKSWGSRSRSTQIEDLSQGMREVEGDRILLARLYPIERARPFFPFERDWYE